jgi:hypothetical protein
MFLEFLVKESYSRCRQNNRKVLQYDDIGMLMVDRLSCRVRVLTGHASYASRWGWLHMNC